MRKFNLYYLLIILLVVCGCSSNDPSTINIQESNFSLMHTPTLLSAAICKYYQSFEKWPDSIEKLETFCEEKKENFELNWSVLRSTTSFNVLTNGSLLITSNDPNFSLDMTLHPPQKGEL